MMSNLSEGWSAPSAIGTAGVGVGGQIGAELTDFVIILNTLDAVKAFSMGGNVTLGVQLFHICWFINFYQWLFQ